MKLHRNSASLAAGLVSLSIVIAAAGPQAAAAKEASMPAPVVFFDIAGPDVAKLSGFYSTVFGWDIAADGRFVATASPQMPALIRGTTGTDPTEKVIYLGVEDVTATLAKIGANGGATVFPRLVVPGVTILGMFTDPAGNRMGLIEIKDGEPIVP